MNSATFIITPFSSYLWADTWFIPVGVVRLTGSLWRGNFWKLLNIQSWPSKMAVPWTWHCGTCHVGNEMGGGMYVSETGKKGNLPNETTHSSNWKTVICKVGHQSKNMLSCLLLSQSGTTPRLSVKYQGNHPCHVSHELYLLSILMNCLYNAFHSIQVYQDYNFFLPITRSLTLMTLECIGIKLNDHHSLF